MITKHNILMTIDEYFAVKNYLVELETQGKLDNDLFMQKFYKSFVVNSSIKINRKENIFNNPEVIVIFDLEDNHTLLSTIGLFCREHSMDLIKNKPVAARALRKIKNYISAESIDILGL